MKRLTFFALLFVLSSSVFSQELKKPFDIKEHCIAYPMQYKKWSYRHGVGVSFTFLPKDWLESAYSFPMVNYKSVLGIKKGFSLNTDIRAIIVANEFRFGPMWNHEINDKFSFAIGYQFAYNLGLLYEFGFDNKLHVTMHHPQLKFGYRYKDLLFTLRGGIEFANTVNYSAGQTVIDGKINFLNGYNAAFFIEQRLFKNKAFNFGAIANWNKFQILGWPAFYYSKQTYFIPEVSSVFVF